MKRTLKLFLWVLIIALVITVAQYQTFTALFAGELNFIVNVVGNVSVWTSCLDSIEFWKYAIIAIALVFVVLSLIFKFLKTIFKKKHRKHVKASVRPVNKVVVTPTTNTSSTKKFTRV